MFHHTGALTSLIDSGQPPHPVGTALSIDYNRYFDAYCSAAASCAFNI